jgi:hypothetical protein
LTLWHGGCQAGAQVQHEHQQVHVVGCCTSPHSHSRRQSSRQSSGQASSRLTSTSSPPPQHLAAPPTFHPPSTAVPQRPCHPLAWRQQPAPGPRQTPPQGRCCRPDPHAPPAAAPAHAPPRPPRSTPHPPAAVWRAAAAPPPACASALRRTPAAAAAPNPPYWHLHQPAGGKAERGAGCQRGQVGQVQAAGAAAWRRQTITCTAACSRRSASHTCRPVAAPTGSTQARQQCSAGRCPSTRSPCCVQPPCLLPPA